MRSALAAVACLAALACASTAQAEQRYAAPEGKGGEPCAQAAPCSLKDAVTKAETGDEIIIGTGTYSLGEGGLFNSAGDLNVHGDPSGPMPKIVATTMSPPLFLPEPGNRVSYLEVVNTHDIYAGGIFCTPKGRVERVRVTVSGVNAVGINLASDCVLRDTIARADGESAVAILGYGVKTTGVARNVTAIATGPGSVGIRSSYNDFSEPGTYTLDLKNVIAGGETADIQATKQGYSASAGPGNVVVSNSNFDVTGVEGVFGSATIADLGGNQTAAPLFVDAANGDYREAAGSPTIDGGVADQIGALDLAGNARVLGAAPDIGAFEFPSPLPPAAAGQIQSLTIGPSTFRTANFGGAILSATKVRAPVGAAITYSLSAAAPAEFTVEHRLSGRKVGKKCAKKTRANKGKRKCALYKAVKGSFTHAGATGQNMFKFSGRIDGKALKPGRYELFGSAGGPLKHAPFRIVK
jgi:hypothetical protein